MASLVYFLIAFGLIAIDQLSKVWAATATVAPIPLIPDVFELRYAENRGIAFSMLQGQRWIFVPVSLLMVVVLALMLLRSPLRKHLVFSLSCTMVLAGAIGNVIDRVVHGYVIDFLYFKLIDFPIFNFADCCVVVGAILLCGCLLFAPKAYMDMPLRTMLFGIRKKEKNHG